MEATLQQAPHRLRWKHCIVTPTNEVVDNINNEVLRMSLMPELDPPGPVYLSHDTTDTDDDS